MTRIKGKPCRIYGNERTELRLSAHAEEAYSDTNPLTIIEWLDGTYSFRGAMERDDMTAEEVNEALEDLWHDCFSGEEEPTI